jgi:predicted enzyme related to lactoylglutathione lyase
MTQTATRIEAAEVERHPGKFVWFELFTPDAARAQAFYREVLGWKVQPFPMAGGRTYEMVYAGDTMIGGYAPPRRPGEPSRWVGYASVPDVDRTVAEAVAAGARVVEPAADIPDVGRRAGLVDPQGVEFSIFRSLMGDPPDTPSVPEGRWLWNELHVPDVPAALGFYGRVLGYEHRAFPGGGEPYTILSRDGVDRGGATSAGCEHVAPHWLPYVHVQDVDGAAQRTRRAGGQVLMVEDIPGVGRIAVIADPTGALIAMISPQPAMKKA